MLLCGEIDSDANLSECKEKTSWITLLDAAKIRKHERIISVPVGEKECPNIPVRYHRTCWSTFTHKNDLLKLSEDDEKEDPGQSGPRRSSRDSNGGESVILPKHCIFCKKDKYKPKSTTREIKGSKEPTHGSAYIQCWSWTENKKAWCCLSWFYIFLRSEEWVYFLNVKIGSWCKTSFLFRILKAYCKTWTPGPLRSLNTLNQKGPLTLAGSSPYCVLHEVVSEDIVIKFVSHIFCLQRKITLLLDPSTKICWVLKNRACYLSGCWIFYAC